MRAVLTALVLLLSIALPVWAAPPMTWDSGFNGANNTLSLSNTVTTNTSGSGQLYSTLGTIGYTVGTDPYKVVFTITFNTDNFAAWEGGVGSHGVNLGPGSTTDSGSAYISTPNGQSPFSKTVDITSSTHCRGDTVGTSGTLWVAIDYNNGKMWCNTSCSWVSGSPDSGASEIADLANTVQYYPVVRLSDAGSLHGSSTINGSPTLTGCSGLTGFNTFDNPTGVATGSQLLLRSFP